MIGTLTPALAGLAGHADALSPWLLRTGIDVALLVLVVLLVERLLGRWLTPRWHYALWLLVVVRMALPVLPEIPGGGWLQAALPSPVATPASLVPGVPGADTPHVPSSARRADRNARPAATPPNNDAVSDPVPAPEPVTLGLDAPVRLVAPEPRWSWLTLLVGAWLCGTVLLLLHAGWRELRFRRRLGREARPVTDPALLAALARECRTLGLRRRVALLETQLVPCPAVHGVLRPRVLLPAGFARELSPRDLDHVLLHELAHVRSHDVLLNWALLLVGCVHWWNPLAHVAVRRLRQTRETLRDWQVLGSGRVSEPRDYAHTLLRILEQPATGRAPAPVVGFLFPLGDARRRIVMITRFAPSRPRHVLFGAAVVLLLAWSTLTHAGRNAVVGTPDDAATNGPTIRVERQSSPPEWYAAVEQRLETEVVPPSAEMTLDEGLEFLRQGTGLNFLVEHYVRDNVEGELFELIPDHKIRASHVLTQYLERHDLAYCLTDGLVYISEPDRLPRVTDLRFYQVASLVDWRDRDPVARYLMEEQRAQLLQELVHIAVGEDSWYEGSGMVYWNGLLGIRQTDATHTQIEHFLNQLLSRGAAPVKKSNEDWRAGLEQQLAKTVSVRFDDSLAAAARSIMREHQIKVMVPEHARDEEVHLIMNDVPLASALHWLSRSVGLEIAHRDGAVVLSEQPFARLGYYRIGKILAAAPSDPEGDVDGDPAERPKEELSELLQRTLLVNTWGEYDNVWIAFWDDVMVVSHTDTAHEQIGRFVAALERALE